MSSTSSPLVLFAALRPAAAVLLAWLALVAGCGNDATGGDPGSASELPDEPDPDAPAIDASTRPYEGDTLLLLRFPGPGLPPERATNAFLQEKAPGESWRTSHTVYKHNGRGGPPFAEGFVGEHNDDASAGAGPDEFFAPELDDDSTYRVCIHVIVGTPAEGRFACSSPFSPDAG